MMTLDFTADVPMAIATGEQLATTAAAAAADLAQRVMPDQRELRVAEQFNKAGYGFDGRWKHSPVSAKREALDQFQRDYVAEVLVDLAALNETVISLEVSASALESVTLGAPSPAAVFQIMAQRAPQPSERITLDLLEEQRAATRGPELRAMRPSRLLQEYQAANVQPNTSMANWIIRSIERMVIDKQVAPVQASAEGEAAAMQALVRAVNETRAGRVPPQVKAWREAARQARRVLDMGLVPPYKFESR